MIIEKPSLRESSDKIVVNNPNDIIRYLNIFYEEISETEHFSVVALDTNHTVISMRVISSGSISKTIVHPREVFRKAIMDNAYAIILAHNHPSGVSLPSDMDKDLTRRLVEAGEIIGINVIDHIILGQKHYSFLEHNQIVKGFQGV